MGINYSNVNLSNVNIVSTPSSQSSPGLTNSFIIAGTGTVNIPPGYSQVVIEVWGGGGSGGVGYSACCAPCYGIGGGGGSGAYARYTLTGLSPYYGQKFSYSVGSGGLGTGSAGAGSGRPGNKGNTSTVSVTPYGNFSGPWTTMISGGGLGGAGCVGPGGAGGTASGGPAGTILQSGYTGSAGPNNAPGPAPGAPAVVGLSTPYGGAGSPGVCYSNASVPGNTGTIRFTWS